MSECECGRAPANRMAVVIYGFELMDSVLCSVCRRAASKHAERLEERYRLLLDSGVHHKMAMRVCIVESERWVAARKAKHAPTTVANVRAEVASD